MKETNWKKIAGIFILICGVIVLGLGVVFLVMDLTGASAVQNGGILSQLADILIGVFLVYFGWSLTKNK